MRRVLLTFCLAAGLGVLAGCQTQGQDTYNADEIGKTSAVSFGTIVATRPINIVGENSGAGALVGGAGGGIAGSQIGAGGGNAAAVLGGVVVGAIVGALAEQAMSDRKGVEYTVVLQAGATITVAQEAPKPGEQVLKVGDRVIVQNSGGYQRVLSAANLPTEIKRPQGIKIQD